MGEKNTKNATQNFSVLYFSVLIGSTNLALNRPVQQSRSVVTFPPSNAVDGSINNYIDINHAGPWWQVQLDQQYLLGHFVFYNRKVRSLVKG